ncbi:MAG: hypothetical protein HY985_04775 [Magnetospirillum sp.]|nr:hypothetical protein [Magnetospirillum sp.]
MRIAVVVALVMLASGCTTASTYQDAQSFLRHGHADHYRSALRQAAEGGDPEAMVELANDIGIRSGERLRWQDRAAEAGSAEGAAGVALHFLFQGADSSEPTQYRDRALAALRRAAALGERDMMHMLAGALIAMGGDDALAEAERLLVDLSSDRCEAEVDLGRLWTERRHGHALDWAEGRRYFERASANGCPRAHALLAYWINQGRYGDADPAQAALAEARKGEDAACGSCQKVIGDLLSDRGEWEAAAAAWRKAADLGETQAARALAEAIFAGDIPDPHPHRTALGWLLAADYPQSIGERAAIVTAEAEAADVNFAQEWAEAYFRGHFVITWTDTVESRWVRIFTN